MCTRALSAAAGAARMRAWRVHAYGALGELRLDEARVPPLRAPDDVLVRVSASSINPIDVAMIGGYGARALNALRALEGEGDVEFPLVPGRDFVGEVQRAGPAARLRRAARVWGVLPPHRPGAHAQFVVVRDCWAGPAPDELDDMAAGGALYAALTACSALRAAGLPADAGARPPRARVLLLGLGGVGQAALQLLVRRGAEVTVGCSGDLTSLALQLGAARALDRHLEDYEQQLSQCGPYEAVLDCAGLGGAGAAHVGRFARYVTLSSPLLRETDARGLGAGALVAAAALLAQGACVAAGELRPGGAGAGAGAGACAGRALPAHVRWAFFAARAGDIELVRRLAARGQFVVRVERAFAWWRAREAYSRAAAGGARGKLLLDFSAAPDADLAAAGSAV